MSRDLFKTHPNLKEIDQFSRKMAELFLVAYPQWESYFGAETFHGETYLTIEVPSPVKPTELDLVISAYEEKLTIYFDRSHAHFEPNGRPLNEEEAHSAEISELLNQGWKRRKLTDEDFNRMWQLVNVDDSSLKRIPLTEVLNKAWAWTVFQSDQLIFDNAKQFIDQILAEHVFVCIYIEKGNYRGGGWVSPETLPILTEKQPAFTGYTRSWLGNYDKIYD